MEDPDASEGRGKDLGPGKVCPVESDEILESEVTEEGAEEDATSHTERKRVTPADIPEPRKRPVNPSSLQ